MPSEPMRPPARPVRPASTRGRFEARHRSRRPADEQAVEQRAGTGPDGGSRETARSPTRGPPRRSRRRARGRASSSSQARPKRARSRGSSSSTPVTPSTIWSWIPPALLATTGRAFHIASATVSPKPSARLFCDHHLRAALDRVDDRGVLLDVVHRQAGEVHPRPHRRRERRAQRRGPRPGPRRPRGRRRPRRRSARRAAGGRRRLPQCSANPRSDPDRVLEPVPARDLGDERRLRRDPARPGRAPPRGRLGPGEPSERSKVGRDAVPARSQPGAGEDRLDRIRRELLVLRREGVDRGRDDPDPVLGKPLPGVLAAGEHVGVRGLDVIAQEGPGLAGDLVRQVDADVAAPDDGRARLEQGPHQAGRLRVVAEDDVARAHGPRQLGRRSRAASRS